MRCLDLKQVIKTISEETFYGKVPLHQIVYSFIVRDFKIWWTYKLWVTLDISSIILLVATYYLFSLIASPQQVQSAGYTTGGYFTFALVGIAFQQYISSAVQNINQSIRDEQWNGTMETLLSSSTDFNVFLLGETCFSFIVSSAFLITALSIGLLLGAQFHVTPASILSVMVLSALLVSSHIVVGVLNAGIVMKIKQGNPLTMAFSWITQLVSGVFYPLKLLPCYLEWIGRIFPLTYSLDGIRLCLQAGQDLSSPAVLNDIINLVIFMILATPIALYVFKLGYDAARKDGSLGEY